jgi:hypothetical protein
MQLDEATSPAAPRHHFIYLAVPSISDGQPQFIAFSSTNILLIKGENPTLLYTRSWLLICWPATTQDQQASSFQPCIPLYPYTRITNI